MSDDDKTDPNLARYLRAEGWFDRHIGEPLTGSPWTLAVAIVWTVACVGFGFWVRG